MRCNAWFVALLSLLSSCARAQRESSERACVSACAALAGSSCSADERARCLNACRTERSTARNAECLPAYDRFLACVSQGENACDSDPGAALMRGLRPPRCQREHDAYASCAEACHDHGVLRTATRNVPTERGDAQVMAEMTVRGCGQSLEPSRRGAGPGSRCEHSSVCDAVDCSCAMASEGYRVRACVDFRCAEPAAACRLAPVAVGHRACRP